MSVQSEIAAAMAPFEVSLAKAMPNGWPEDTAHRIAAGLRSRRSDAPFQKADDAWTEREVEAAIAPLVSSHRRAA